MIQTKNKVRNRPHFYPLKSISNWSISLILPLLIAELLLEPALKVLLFVNISLIIIILFIINFCLVLLRPYKNTTNLLLLLALIILFLSYISIQNFFGFEDQVKYFIVNFSFILSFLIIVSDIDDKCIIRMNDLLFILCVISIIVLLTNKELLIKSFQLKARGMLRNSGFSIFAISIVSHLIFLSSLLKSTFKIRKLLLYSSLLLVLFFSLLSQSRGPVLALFTTSLLYMMIKGSFMKSIFSFFAVSTFFVAIVIYRGNIFLSFSARNHLIKKSFDLYINNLLGAGVGSLEPFIGFSYPHNLFVEYFVELGPFFTIIFLLLNIMLYFIYLNCRYLFKHNHTLLFPLMIYNYFFFWFIFSGSAVRGLRILLPFMFLSYKAFYYAIKR